MSLIFEVTVSKIGGAGVPDFILHRHDDTPKKTKKSKFASRQGKSPPREMPIHNNVCLKYASNNPSTHLQYSKLHKTSSTFFFLVSTD